MLLYSFICSPSDATKLYQNNYTFFNSDLEHEILLWNVPTTAVLSVLKFCRAIASSNPCAVCSATPVADNKTNRTVTSSTCYCWSISHNNLMNAFRDFIVMYDFLTPALKRLLSDMYPYVKFSVFK